MRDIPEIMRIYRGQSDESKRFHHPYPFDRPRLAVLLLYIVVVQRIVRALIPRTPNLAFVLLVAFLPPSTQLVGYASIRFVRRGAEPVWGRFGFLVSEPFRGRGVASALAVVLYESCLELGVPRGGGTIQAENIASQRVVERYGFHLVPAQEVDRFAPGRPNLEGVEDLRHVLEQVRAHRAAHGDPDVLRERAAS